MSDIKVDEKGFVRHGHAKICRLTDSGLEFQVNGRHGTKTQIVVPKEQIQAILAKPIDKAQKVE